MSQEKVNKYKEQKANRKELMKKEKRAKLIRNSITGIVLVAAIGWVGYSGVTYIIKHQPRAEANVNYTSVADYAESLAPQETPEGTSEQVGAVEDDATVEVTE